MDIDAELAEIEDVDFDALLEESKIVGSAAMNDGPDDWLKGDHEYFTGDDGQEYEDVEIQQQARETLLHFVYDFSGEKKSEMHHPSHPDFEHEFRAFLHNSEYAYNPPLIDYLIALSRNLPPNWTAEMRPDMMDYLSEPDQKYFTR